MSTAIARRALIAAAALLSVPRYAAPSEARQRLPTNPPQIRRQMNAETAAIFRVIVAERLAAKGEAPAGDYLVVVDQTLTFCPKIPESQQQPPCIYAPLVESMSSTTVLPLVPAELKERVVAENLQPFPLPPLNVPSARLVPLSTITDIFADKGWWTEFYRRFPHSRGYLEFTKPTFSADGLDALVYVSHSCGGLCGTGWLVYLSRTNGAWRIVDKHMLWIS